MTKDGIAIFYIGQDDLIDLLATSMVSVCYNTKALINFYILDCGISDFNKEQLESLKKDFDNFTIEYLPVDLTIFQGIKKYKGFSDFWAKLLIPDIKQDISKAIYLDTDTIALADVEEFWNQDFDGCALAAVPAFYYDRWRDETFKKHYPISKNFLFINTGTLLIDCERWRKEKIFDKLMALIRKYNDVLDQAVGFDEIILSLYFEDNFKILDGRFNSTDHENTLQEFRAEYSDSYLDNEWKHVVIRHFAGSDKPWFELRNDYNNQILKNYSAFWFFAQMTPWGSGMWNRFQESIFRKNAQNKSSPVKVENSDWHSGLATKRRYYLFNVFLFLKAKIKGHTYRSYLFGLIPFLKITTKNKKRYYKLFGFIPFLKIKDK